MTAFTGGDSAEGERRHDAICFVVVCAALFAGMLTMAILFVLFVFPCATYSVAIDSVSGLDVAVAALNPEFNLTLRVASESYGRRGCIGPRAYLEVRYRCAKLATSETSPEELCAGPRKWSEIRHVVARGTGVRLPGYLLDSLMEDARRGVEVFEVTLRRHDDDSFSGMVTEGCGLRRVGDAASALRHDGYCTWRSMPACNDGAGSWDNNSSNSEERRT